MTNLSLLLVLLVRANCETINRDQTTDYTPVSCTSFPCIINCNVDSSCRNTNISCPSIGSGNCAINLIGSDSARNSIIFSNNAIYINISCNGATSLQSSVIHAYQIVDTKLYIDVLHNSDPLRYTTIYAPYGITSELNINCGSNSITGDYLCADMKIYDDYSTNVYLKSYSTYGFHSTEIRSNITEIFGITKSFDITYRGSVNLFSFISDGGFYLFK
eukprot:386012_1